MFCWGGSFSSRGLKLRILRTQGFCGNLKPSVFLKRQYYHTSLGEVFQLGHLPENSMPSGKVVSSLGWELRNSGVGLALPFIKLVQGVVLTSGP